MYQKVFFTYNWIELVLLTVYLQFKRKPGTTKFGRSFCPFLVWMKYVITDYLLQYVYYISVVYIFVKVESVVELCLEWINLRVISRCNFSRLRFGKLLCKQ